MTSEYQSKSAINELGSSIRYWLFISEKASNTLNNASNAIVRGEDDLVTHANCDWGFQEYCQGLICNKFCSQILELVI